MPAPRTLNRLPFLEMRRTTLSSLPCVLRQSATVACDFLKDFEDQIETLMERFGDVNDHAFLNPLWNPEEEDPDEDGLCYLLVELEASMICETIVLMRLWHRTENLLNELSITTGPHIQRSIMLDTIIIEAVNDCWYLLDDTVEGIGSDGVIYKSWAHKVVKAPCVDDRIDSFLAQLERTRDLFYEKLQPLCNE